MIKAIIIEDETKSRDALLGLLQKYCPSVLTIGHAEGYRKGIELVKELKPDVVFLDVQMPDGSGFRLLDELKHVEFEVIFTTAFDQFAIKAIRYSALDYLLKPIVPEELVNAIKKLEKKLVRTGKDKNIETLMDNIKSPEEDPHKIVLSTAEKIHVIDVNDIVRCESDNYYTYYFFVNGTKLLVSKTLKENEELLSDHNFIRPHKSHLINIKYIENFSRQGGGHITMTDGSQVPVSRRKREQIMDILWNL